MIDPFLVATFLSGSMISVSNKSFVGLVYYLLIGFMVILGLDSASMPVSILLNLTII